MKLQTSILLICLAAMTTIRADPATENVQQALKDQGYYYGAINGEKNADTIAAIRRYQIRNGLQVTGDLNEETLHSIQSNAATAQPSPGAPLAQPTPAPPATSDLHDDSGRQSEGGATPTQPDAPSHPGQGPNVGQAVPSAAGLFTGTPYETAPEQVQRRVISDAQRILARRGLFNGAVDGAYGPDLEFSLRAYQSRVGISRSGRLDLETLAALQLLPGARQPVFVPRHPIGPSEPPVRGEWIRP